MTTNDLKSSISAALQAFATVPMRKAAMELFAKLGYSSERTLATGSVTDFCEQFDSKNRLDHPSAMKAQWQSVELLFQLTDEELSSTASLFRDTTVSSGLMRSYVFFAIELKPSSNANDYARGKLAAITRQINRLFPMPVMVLFKVPSQQGDKLCLAVINRRTHKRDDSRDVMGKVTLIQNISIAQPHRGHLDILASFSVPELQSRKTPIGNFDELHAAWETVFNVELLNKRFYEELSNWYFWARKQVNFPDDLEKDTDKRNATSVIRLLTRLIFCWFLKEKDLIPDRLFDVDELKEALTKFNALDSEDSTYYRAILQNLFFATLNQPMNVGSSLQRRFANEGTFQEQKEDYGNDALYRYADAFKDSARALALFEDIPLLNGGLFASLDSLDDKGKKQYADGFSRTPKKQAFVPNHLFFAAEKYVDLSADYGDAKKKKAKVRGLIHILQSYKFTIAESTPVEQEIALDPELLGNVFENLLASYNPETKESARKQTGSFYTPRPIVDYMVDESLKAYLARALQQALPKTTELDAKTGLDILFAYTEREHVFTKPETTALINAIDACNILDPACGSGAYPMGILHKLVFILGKLDKDNAQWKQRQTDNAERFEDAGIREASIEKIERNFADNNLDYGRKLYLIENCIYGVDLQPIAIQIAKLRFFISLVCDQKTHRSKPNLGIEPLPNLEIKFVAANTLMGLDVPAERSVFENPVVIDLERDLEKVRHRYFAAQTRKLKLELQKRDRELTKKILAELEHDDIGNEDVRRRVMWDPYDPQTAADFFDPAKMFGPSLANGFDVVIGNPPYVRADGAPEYMAMRHAILATKRYQTLWEKWDLYIPFIERGYQLLSPGGITSMIVSDAYCHAKYAQKSQNWFLQNARVARIDFLSNIQVFQAAVRNVIYFYQKEEGQAHTPERRLHGAEFGDVKLLPSAPQSSLTYRAFFPDDAAKASYGCKVTPLSALCYISKGMVINADEKSSQGAFKTHELLSRVQDDTHPKRFVEGKNLDAWCFNQYSWLEWGTDRAPSQFSRQTFPELYEHAQKLMLPKVGDIRAAVDDERMVCHDGIYVAVPWHQLKGVRNKSLKKVARYQGELPVRADLPKREQLEKDSKGFDILYLLGVLNSRTAHEFLRANRRNNIQLYPDDWKKLPVPDASAAVQAKVVAIVQKILTLLKTNPLADVQVFHAELHELVAGIYAGIVE
jgi:adenine-specific DNA-methyltransferase